MEVFLIVAIGIAALLLGAFGAKLSSNEKWQNLMESVLNFSSGILEVFFPLVLFIIGFGIVGTVLTFIVRVLFG